MGGAEHTWRIPILEEVVLTAFEQHMCHHHLGGIEHAALIVLREQRFDGLVGHLSHPLQC